MDPITLQISHDSPTQLMKIPLD